MLHVKQYLRVTSGYQFLDIQGNIDYTTLTMTKRGRPKDPDFYERDKRIAELRKKGWTYAAIAKVYGISRQRAHQIILEQLLLDAS